MAIVSTAPTRAPRFSSLDEQARTYVLHLQAGGAKTPNRPHYGERELIVQVVEDAYPEVSKALDTLRATGRFPDLDDWLEGKLQLTSLDEAARAYMLKL